MKLTNNVGAVTVTWLFDEPVNPVVSVTTRETVYVPATVYAWVAVELTELNVVLSPKFQLYV